MSKDQSLHMDQRIGMRLSVQQLKFVKLLELNAPELDEAVDMALDENPALEAADSASEDSLSLTDEGKEFSESAEEIQKADYSSQEEIPHYRLDSNNRSRDDKGYEYIAPDEEFSLYDFLNSQLSERDLPGDIALAAEYIVGNLDSNGYLTRTIHQLADDMAMNLAADLPEETIEKGLEVVRTLDPKGTGARNLRECLLIQLEAMPADETRNDALDIIRNHFEAFSMKHSHRIISGTGIGASRVKNAMRLILSLNPKPGASIGSGPRQEAGSVVPDFIIGVENGEITVQLNNHFPELRIEESFENAVRRMERNVKKRETKKGNEFVLSRYNDARDFIAILKQRQETLFAVMTAIVKFQKEYFLTEDVHALRPMMIKDISEMTHYDFSVISRATNNKYAATPWGIFPLRFFFSDSLGKDGEEVTNKEIEAEISQLVETEDKLHPLSDENIKDILESKGYELSRRTIAKYRDRLGIPVARLRKNL